MNTAELNAGSMTFFRCQVADIGLPHEDRHAKYAAVRPPGKRVVAQRIDTKDPIMMRIDRRPVAYAFATH